MSDYKTDVLVRNNNLLRNANWAQYLSSEHALKNLEHLSVHHATGVGVFVIRLLGHANGSDNLEIDTTNQKQIKMTTIT